MAAAPWRRGELAAGVATLGLLAAAYLPGLATATLLPDELVYLEAGAAYLDGDLSLNPEHPPLAKLAFGLGQRLVGDPVLGGRIVAVLVGLATAAALYALVARLAGRRWGLVAAGLWALLPHTLRWAGQPAGGLDKLDRFAMLDPVAAGLGFVAVVLALHAVAREPEDPDGRPSRLRAGTLVAAGVVAGLAGAAKLSALLLLPVVLAVPLVAAGGGRLARRLAVATGTGVAAVAGFLVVYLPFVAEAPLALSQIVTIQADHATAGHRILLAGTVYERAPWWANLWYQWRDDGPVLTVALWLAAAVGAVWGPARRELRWLLAAAVVVPMAGMATSSVALPHYRYLWLAPTTALAALGLAALWRRTRGRPAAPVVAGLLALVLVGAGGRSVWHTATRDAGDYRAVASLVTGEVAPAAAAAPSVLVHGYPRVLAFYLPGMRQVSDLPADVVVLDPAITSRHPVPALERELADGGYTRVRVDRLEVWLRPRRPPVTPARDPRPADPFIERDAQHLGRPVQ